MPSTLISPSAASTNGRTVMHHGRNGAQTERGKQKQLAKSNVIIMQSDQQNGELSDTFQ